MIEIKYRTRVFIDRKTKRITIHAKEIIDKYKDENYKTARCFVFTPTRKSTSF